MDWFNNLLPVATLLLGYGGSLLTESRRDRRLLAREREHREAERERALSDQRRTFELESLQEARSALTALGRSCGRIHTAQQLRGEPSDEDRQENFEAMRRLHRVTDLLMDENLRQSVTAVRLKAALIDSPWSTVAETSTTPILDVVTAIDAAQEDIAERIRLLHTKAMVTTS